MQEKKEAENHFSDRNRIPRHERTSFRQQKSCEQLHLHDVSDD